MFLNVVYAFDVVCNEFENCVVGCLLVLVYVMVCVC